MLGSHGCFVTASASAWSLRPVFFFTHCWSWMSSTGYVEATRVWLKADQDKARWAPRESPVRRRESSEQLLTLRYPASCSYLQRAERVRESGPTFLSRPTRAEQCLRLQLWNKLTDYTVMIGNVVYSYIRFSMAMSDSPQIHVNLLQSALGLILDLRLKRTLKGTKERKRNRQGDRTAAAGR